MANRTPSGRAGSRRQRERHRQHFVAADIAAQAPPSRITDERARAHSESIERLGPGALWCGQAVPDNSFGFS